MGEKLRAGSGAFRVPRRGATDVTKSRVGEHQEQPQPLWPVRFAPGHHIATLVGVFGKVDRSADKVALNLRTGMRPIGCTAPGPTTAVGPYSLQGASRGNQTDE